jgi:CHAT domain-containing protein
LEVLLGQAQDVQALEVAEQARARAFLDLLATRQIEVTASEQAELDAIRQIERDLAQRGVDPVPSALRAAAPLAPPRPGDDSTASLLSRWQQADPELRSLVAVPAFSFAQMAATAARLHSTVLAYWVSPEQTFIWVIAADGTMKSRRVSVTAERLAELVRDTVAGVETGGASEATSAALLARGPQLLVLKDTQARAGRALYDLLIEPVKDSLPTRAGSRLTIVPHGALFRLSFAALIDGSDRYLLESYAVHYAPATAVFEFTARTEARVAGRSPRYLLVSDPENAPRLADGRDLPALPGAAREVEAIASALPSRTVTVLRGERAREGVVRSATGKHSVIHLATHAVVLDTDPLDSFLALGAAPDSDGRLTAREMYALDLRASLVVLSACRSADGRVSGDGVIGLARALLYAGTPSVVASLWDVADEPTMRLMPGLYRALTRTGSKSAALRAAQLRLLQDLRLGRVTVQTPAGSVTIPEHPIFWAGFILIGEP